MAAILNLTTGVVYLQSWSGLVNGGSLTLSGNLIVNGTITSGAGEANTIPFTLSGTALATTSTDGLILINPTAATAGATVQISPRIKWSGTAYNSVSTLSETDFFVAEVLPATNAGATTATWKLGASIAGGGVTYPLTLSSGGNLTALGQVAGNVLASATAYNIINKLVLSSPLDGQMVLSDAEITHGIGLDVTTDSTLKVRTRAQTGYATVDALGYKVNATTFPAATIGPSSPTGTSSTTLVMAGLGGAITTQTGRVEFTMSGVQSDGTASDGSKVQISFGTGTAPVNGAALTGTQVGPVLTFTVPGTTAAIGNYGATWIVTGLVVGTAYWFDTAFAAVTGGTATITQASMTARDIP